MPIFLYLMTNKGSVDIKFIFENIFAFTTTRKSFCRLEFHMCVLHLSVPFYRDIALNSKQFPEAAPKNHLFKYEMFVPFLVYFTCILEYLYRRCFLFDFSFIFIFDFSWRIRVGSASRSKWYDLNDLPVGKKILTCYK